MPLNPADVRPRLRVLLVEDSDADAMLFLRYAQRITSHEWSVEHAANLDEARTLSLSRQYDCYFIDYRLGPDDGIELIRALRLSGCTAPIILITGIDDDGVAGGAMRAGANRILAKTDVSQKTLEQAATLTDVPGSKID